MCHTEVKVSVTESDALARSHGGIYLGETNIATKSYSTTKGEKCCWLCCAGHYFQATHETVQQGIWCPKCAELREQKQASSPASVDQKTEAQPALQEAPV